MKSLSIAAVLLSAAVASAEPVAFPGAEGFGAKATGGRGQPVVHVTNLNEDGPGSLREAVSQPNRTVVFDVGGVINVKKQIAINDNITLAGQTAPGGVSIYGAGISCSGHTNIIVRYMTMRCGSAAGRSSKALNITDASNIIVDHCSLGWASWDNGGITGKTTNVTVQNCMLEEAIKVQNFGMIIDGVRQVSIVKNLWINNRGRNPKGKGDLQYINNVIYNWGNQGFGGGHSGAPWNQDLIGNYMIAGPDSSNNFFSFTNANDLVYSQGNFVDLDKDGQLNGRAWTEADVTHVDPKSNEGAKASTQPYNKPDVPVTVLTAQQAVELAIASAGNSLHRDSVDQRQVDQLKSYGKLGKHPDTEADVGGMPAAPAAEPAPKDTDQDGIPDDYETAHGLSPSDANDANKVTETGYTNLEAYLNSLIVAK